MAKVTKIKANDSPKKPEEDEPTLTRKKVVVKDKKTEKSKQKAKKAQEKAIDQPKDTEKKPFILIRPFVYLGRYIKEAWQELRQVHWPNRKMTWKMLIAVLVYTAIFMIFISLLDMFFTWLFNNIF